MVNYIKNNSTQGIYITVESGANIANNTPGNIDLDLLTLGTHYIYLDSVMRLEHRLSFTSEGGTDSTWVGHNISAQTPGKATSWTGQADKGNLIIMAEVDTITGYWIKRFAKQNNRTSHDKGAGQKYLVHQYASEVFEEFPSNGLASKKYVPVLISGCFVIEMEGIKDRKQASIGMWEMW
jgi:hypothetical protein